MNLIVKNGHRMDSNGVFLCAVQTIVKKEW